MSQFQTTAEVAITLGVSRRTVLNLIARGDLRATRVGRQWRIPVSELERMESGSSRNGSSKGAPRGVRKEPSNIVPIGPVRHALIPFTEVGVRFRKATSYRWCSRYDRAIITLTTSLMKKRRVFYLRF